MDRHESLKARVSHVRFCSQCAQPLEWRFIEEHKRECKVCTGCGFTYFFNPKVAAGTLIVHQGQILLLRRGIEPGYGLWSFPGGFVDLGESAQEGAIRETMEEVGLEVCLGEPAGVYISTRQDVVIIVFWASITGGEAIAGDECLETRYFAPSEIPWAELAFPSTRQLLLRHFPATSA